MIATIRARADFVDRSVLAWKNKQYGVVGKIYPEGVAFTSYELADEDFIGLNYLACHKWCADMIASLKCPPLTAA